MSFVLCLAFAMAPPLPAPKVPPKAKDVSQWRGPARDGVIPLTRSTWPPTLRNAWSVKTGIGHSSPVVADGRVFVFSREGEDEMLEAFELGTGKELWAQAYPARYAVNPAAASHGKGPKATPVVSEGRVFTFGISGIASAYEAATGKVIWRRNFEETALENMPAFGVASSPLVLDGLLLFTTGDRDKGALVALDPATGHEKWRFNGEGPAYASPVVADIGRMRQIVTFTRSRLVGLSAHRGALLWSVPFTTDYDQNAVTPFVRDGIVVYSGLSKGVMAIRPVQTGLHFRLEKVWSNPEVAMYLSSPVLLGDKLIGFSHRKKGQFFALDFKTGKTLWLSDGRQGENASLLAGNGFWMALTDEGRLVVADAQAGTFQPLRTYTVAESATWASPAVSDEGIVVKGVDTLTYWRFD
jgi:outer membrane protein assembly factor BamB